LGLEGRCNDGLNFRPWAEPVPGVDRLVTAEELLVWPEELHFAWRYELVEGRIVRMPPIGLEHSDATQPLFVALRAFVRANGLGLLTMPETGFLLYRSVDGDIVLAPDMGFVSAERAARLPPSGTPERKQYLPLAPDLAVAVASPDQYRPERARKAQLYLARGTRLVWVVWPNRRQADSWRPGMERPAATLGVGDVLDGEDVVPGFTYPVANLFR
jgi:Uma2 family endonuclease